MRETTVKAGVMVYTISEGKLYSDSLPKEGAELVKVISREPGKPFEALVKIHGHLWHLWSGKPVENVTDRPVDKLTGAEMVAEGRLPNHLVI